MLAGCAESEEIVQPPLNTELGCAPPERPRLYSITSEPAEHNIEYLGYHQRSWSYIDIPWQSRDTNTSIAVAVTLEWTVGPDGSRQVQLSVGDSDERDVYAVVRGASPLHVNFTAPPPMDGHDLRLTVMPVGDDGLPVRVGVVVSEQEHQATVTQSSCSR